MSKITGAAQQGFGFGCGCILLIVVILLLAGWLLYGSVKV